MIAYELDRWNILFAFSLKGSVFPRAFVMAFTSSVIAGVLHIAMHQSKHFSEVVGAGAVGSNILSGFTFILGFLIVFRSQQAYSRWWEGGAMMQQLRGQWYNAISTLFAFCNDAPEHHDEALKFKHHIARMISLQYAFAIAAVSSTKDKRLEVLDIHGFDPQDVEFLQSDECYDPCEVVLQWLQRIIAKAETDGVLKISAPMLARVFNELTLGMVNLSNGRKIMEFPIPFPLAQMITVMLLFHGIATPLICATTIPTAYWACFLCFVVCFSYWTINYIATELEMPFGEDSNDLPLCEMLCDMNHSLMTLLTEQAQKCPSFEFHDEESCRPGVIVIDFDGDMSVVCQTLKPVCKAAVRRSDCKEPKRERRPSLASGPSVSSLGRRPTSSSASLKAPPVAEVRQEKKQVKEGGSCVFSDAPPHEDGQQRVQEGIDEFCVDVHLQADDVHLQADRVEMVASTNSATSSPAVGPARHQDSDAFLSEAQASAFSQLHGFCDIRPAVSTQQQGFCDVRPSAAAQQMPFKDVEADRATPAASSSLSVRPSPSRSPTKSRVRGLRQDSSTVIQVRATACCMPLTPGARLDSMQAVGCRRSVALHVAAPSPDRGDAFAALER